MVKISTQGYSREIGCVHVRHVPFSSNQEMTGILSYQTISDWQCGHDDRGVTID